MAQDQGQSGALGLAGARVLLTRPADQIDETAAQVRAAGGIAVLCPLLRRGPVGAADEVALREALSRRPAVCAFTSQSAVVALREWAERQGQTLAGVLDGVKAVVVGPRTAQELVAAGVPVALVAADSTGAGLAAALLAADWWSRGRVLVPRGREAREELTEALVVAGVDVDPVVVYEMVPSRADEIAAGLDALLRGQVEAVPLLSPRTAELLLQALGAQGRAILGRVVVGAIGRTTAGVLKGAGVRVDVVPRTATFGALLEEIGQVLREKADGEQKQG